MSARDAARYPVLNGVVARVGIDLRVVPDLESWAARHPASVLIIVAATPSDWTLIEQLAGDDRRMVVVLLAKPEPVLYRRALAAGAGAVAPAAAQPAQLIAVLRSGLSGHALIPAKIMRQLYRHDVANSLAPDDVALLRRLAHGHDTKRLATDHGCSERTMYRRLDRLYAFLQVRGRGEAIQTARSLGLLAVRQ